MKGLPIKIYGFQCGHLLTWQFYYTFYMVIFFMITGEQRWLCNGNDFITAGDSWTDSLAHCMGYQKIKIGEIFGVDILHYKKLDNERSVRK